MRHLLVDLPGPDHVAASAIRERAADVLRPTGALARLDSVAEWVGAWQGTATPEVRRPAVVVFAADHGVAWSSPVSAYPTTVTAAMLAAFEAGRSTINAFGRLVGATVAAVDVGVGRPTGDIRVEAALSPERFDEIVDVVERTVTELDADLLVVGEMGIGNTTVAAALSAALIGGEPASWVGRGTGVDDDGFVAKQRAVTAAVERIAGCTDPLEVLRQVGGAELVAIAAAVAAARHRRLPVVLDGYVTTAAVVALRHVAVGALDHCLAGHCSAEPGHRRLLEHLGQAPLLDLDLRLGEGSGALAAVPLIRLACAGVVEVPTFAEWFGPTGP